MIDFVFIKQPGTRHIPSEGVMVLSAVELLMLGKENFISALSHLSAKHKTVPVEIVEYVGDMVDIFFGLAGALNVKSADSLDLDRLVAYAQAATLKEKVSIYREKGTENYYIECYYDCFFGRLTLNQRDDLRKVYVSTSQNTKPLRACLLPCNIAVTEKPLVYQIDLLLMCKED